LSTALVPNRRKYYDLELHEKQQAAKAAKKGAAAVDDEVRPALGFAWFSSSAASCVNCAAAAVQDACFSSPCIARVRRSLTKAVLLTSFFARAWSARPSTTRNDSWRLQLQCPNA